MEEKEDIELDKNGADESVVIEENQADTVKKLKEKLKETEAKAKEASVFVEKLVTKSKNDTLKARRELLRYLQPKLTKKMVEEIGPRYRERTGGYTRITKLPMRKSDSAKMAIIEFVK